MNTEIDKFTAVITSYPFKQLYDLIVKDKYTIVLPITPQIYTQDYVRNHAFKSNPDNPKQMISPNGIKVLELENLLQVCKSATNTSDRWNWVETSITTNITSKTTLKIKENSIQLIYIKEDIFHETTSVIPEKIFEVMNILGISKVVEMKLSHIELSIPNCFEKDFLRLIELLKEPRSEKFCVQIQKYLDQLNSSDIDGPERSRLESIGKLIWVFLDDAENRLKEFVKPKLENINELVVGLESYLLSMISQL